MGNFLNKQTFAAADSVETLAVTAAIFGFFLLVVLATIPQPPHLLVGYGCEGSNGQPMYYTEESDFPPCSLIESAR